MAITTADFQTMPPQVFNRWIVQMQDKGVLLSKIRVQPVDNKQGQIHKIGVGSRLIRKVDEGAELPDAGISTGVISYSTVKVGLKYSLTREAVEDNPEKENVAQIVNNLIQKQMALDLEDLGINGNSTSADAFLQIDDGWIKLAEDSADTHVYDHGGSTIDKSVFFKLDEILPSKYKSSDKLAWLMSRKQFNKYMEYLTNRATAAGDAILLGKMQAINPLNIPIVIPPAWPDSYVMLTPLDNLIMVVQREMAVRVLRNSDDILDKDLYAKWAITARVDFAVEEFDAIALAKNVALA